MARYSCEEIHRLLLESDSTITHERGIKLEQLSKYLFEKIPGVSFLEKNFLDAQRAHEIDIAFWNPQNISPLNFLDAILIIECKNTGRPVGSSDVGWFIRKLQVRGSRHGILIALNGITGESDGISCAHSEVLNALTRDGIKILVVTREEITGLSDTQDLVNILKEKELQLTLYRTIS